MAITIALVAFAAGSLPYLIAARSCPSLRFTGVLGEGWFDTRQHLAWIHHYEHSLRIPNVLTGEATKPFMISAEFSIGALFARLLGGVIAGWHELRLLGLLALSLATMVAACRFLASERRAVAIALALAPPTFAVVVHRIPGLLPWVDPATRDGNSLLFTIEQPQMAIASALVVVAIVGIDRFRELRGARLPTLTVGAVVALWLFHPFEFWAVGVVFAWYGALLVRRGDAHPAARRNLALALGLMGAPALLYLALDVASGGGYRAQVALFGNSWPTPLDLVLSLGLGGVLAIAVAFGWLRADGDPGQRRLLAVWLGGTVLSIYLPAAPFRWHQVDGLHVCVALLAARGRWLAPLVSTRRRRAGAVAVTLCIGIALQMPYLVGVARDATACTEPSFRTPELVEALASLPAHTDGSSVVLTRPELGCDVAMVGAARPYCAGGKTFAWRDKQPLVARFLAGAMNVQEARSFLDGGAITHVLCEPPRDAICRDERLASMGWTRVFGDAAARLYQRRDRARIDDAEAPR